MRVVNLDQHDRGPSSITFTNLKARGLEECVSLMRHNSFLEIGEPVRNP